MDVYSIALICWLYGVFLVGSWSPAESLPPPSGFYKIREPESYSQTEPHQYPDIPNRVPLYRHNDTWRYRVPGGPWIYPTWPELISRAQTENGDPLIEE